MRIASVLVATALIAATLGPVYSQTNSQDPRGMVNGEKSREQGGESEVGRTQPQRPAGMTGGKARDIIDSAGPLTITAAQKEQIRAALARIKPSRVNSVDFTLSVGAAVPQQVALSPLPPEISRAMGGYEGDGYLLVRDQLVIVDRRARRIVALVPGVG